jgi:5-carboxymethyl-2-hydroxymuconate isomerase
MVAAIAERLFRDTQDRDSTNTHALGSIAYKVLQHRDSERASQISAQLDSLIAQSRATLVSNPDTAVIAQQQAPADAQLVTRVFSNVVYIQFMHENERQLASQLRAELNAADMHAPGIELKQGNYKNWVRYFHADDRALAETVAAQAARLASKPGHAVTFRVQDLSAKSFRAPKGQVEVWINLAAPTVVIPSRPG